MVTKKLLQSAVLCMGLCAMYMAACSPSENTSYCDSDTACASDLFCDIDGAFADKAGNTCIDRPEPLACNRMHTCPEETPVCTDLSGGSCVECLENSDCGVATPICAEGNVCAGCEKDADCESQLCDTENLVCIPKDQIQYVDILGTDSESCGTFELPCAQYSQLKTNVESQPHVLFRNGTYTGIIDFRHSKTIHGQDEAILKPPIALQVSSDTHIRNLRFQTSLRCSNMSLSLSEVRFNNIEGSRSALLLEYCDTTIADSEFRTTQADSAIELIGGQLSAARIVVDGNQKIGILSEPTGGLTTPSSISITDSSISNNGEHGIRAVFADLVVTGTTIQSNGKSGINLHASGYSILNNIIIENQNSGIVISFSPRPAPGEFTEDISFNTFVSNLNGAIASAIFCNNANTEAHSNILFGTVTDNDDLIDPRCAPTYSLFSPGDVFVPGVGNVQADPLFVDIAASDFHLQVGSPAINGGNPFASIETDIDGDLRETTNSSPDIGADEYTETQ